MSIFIFKKSNRGGSKCGCPTNQPLILCTCREPIWRHKKMLTPRKQLGRQWICVPSNWAQFLDKSKDPVGRTRVDSRSNISIDGNWHVWHSPKLSALEPQEALRATQSSLTCIYIYILYYGIGVLSLQAFLVFHSFWVSCASFLIFIIFLKVKYADCYQSAFSRTHIMEETGWLETSTLEPSLCVVWYIYKSIYLPTISFSIFCSISSFWRSVKFTISIFESLKDRIGLLCIPKDPAWSNHQLLLLIDKAKEPQDGQRRPLCLYWCVMSMWSHKRWSLLFKNVLIL